ncbi:MAG TPA: iron chelate uptake ABC transporter family permease subunit [Parachlamydiaceae bacterium]|nr:iron chelate uptake ABC transporter family permease subunit [Parachlamydiaceae bacterium]
MQSPFLYFTDAVLRAPTIGCMLMCLSAALIGVIVVLRKQSLVGEALSHAAYPGVVFGVMAAGFLGFGEEQMSLLAFLIMLFAFLSALFGLFCIHWLVSKFKIKPDSALCFILSSFFGIGLLLASEVQFSHSALYRQIQSYLYGQAATMTDRHILIYGILSLVCLLAIILFYKEIQTLSFDMEYAKSLGLNAQAVNFLLFFLIALAVVIGIRSVGVVLMSAMLIAPAVAARQYTNKLSFMFVLSAFFGLLSGFLGNYFSVEITASLAKSYKGERLVLPTGPMIVMMAAIICLFSLCFSKERGWLVRLLRIGCFRYRCVSENLLKAIWRFSYANKTALVSFDAIEKYQSLNPFYLRFLLFRLIRKGFLEKEEDHYKLTKEGILKAEKIIRLHRLWEVYLVNYLGVGVEKVHRSAEEMEHIITPEIELELIALLKDPKEDPHHQPIPPKTSI